MTAREQLIEEVEAVRREMAAIANQDQVSVEEEARFDGLMVKFKRLNGDIPTREPVRPDPNCQNHFRSRTRPGSWTTPAGGEIRAYGPDENICDDLPDHVSQEFRGLTFGAAMRAMITGPRNDLERRALSEGTDSAGGFTVPVFLSLDFIDLLRKKSTALRAGIRTIPLETDETVMAKLLTDPTAAWKAENAAITASDPTFGAVTFKPKTLISQVKLSRELAEDSINLDSILQNSFAQKLAEEIDRVVYIGTGTGEEPKGILNTTGVGSVDMGTNGLAITNYDPIISAIQVVADANGADPEFAVMAPRTWAAISKLKDGQNQPLQRPSQIDNVRFLQTTQIPVDDTHGTATDASAVYIGGFQEVFLGVRNQIRVEISREAGLPNFQIFYTAHTRVDVQVGRPPGLCVITGIIP